MPDSQLMSCVVLWWRRVPTFFLCINSQLMGCHCPSIVNWCIKKHCCTSPSQHSTVHKLWTRGNSYTNIMQIENSESCTKQLRLSKKHIDLTREGKRQRSRIRSELRLSSFRTITVATNRYCVMCMVCTLCSTHRLPYLQYAYFKQMTQAARVIQNQYRSYCEHKRFKKSQEAAVCIQNYYRNYREQERGRQSREGTPTGAGLK